MAKINPSQRKEQLSDIDVLIKELQTSYTLATKQHSLSIDAQFSNLTLDDPSNEAAKSTATATEFMNMGNNYFAHGDYVEAWLSYSGSLCCAVKAEDVAHAYANRSAVLFKLSKYTDSLRDIDRALDGNYPEAKKENLRKRRKKCLIKLEEGEKKSSGRTRGDQDEHAAVTSRSEETEAPAVVEADTEWRNRCQFTNPLLPNTSVKIQLECNDTWGRFLSATEDIEPGEILSSQKFFLKKVLTEGYFNCCSCCMSICHSLIPCPSCNEVMYCSVLCRDRAFNLYHRIECQVFRFKEIHEHPKEEDHMALIMLLIGTEQGAGLNTLMNQLTIRDIFAEKIDPTNKPFVCDYVSTLRLQRTFSKPLFVEKFDADTVAHIVKTIIILNKVGYFVDNPDVAAAAQTKDCLNESELFTAMLLFNHMISIVRNTRSIRMFNTFNGKEHGKEMVVALGLPILHSMINHSCDPNASIIVRGQEDVLVSLRPISKGEQIFISYTDIFAASPKDKRSGVLSKLPRNDRFTCHCVACTNQWPTRSILKKRKVKYLCDSTRIADELEHLYALIMPITDEDAVIHTLSRDEILQIVCKICKWLHKNIEMPSIIIVECESLLFRVMRFFYSTFMQENMTEDSIRSEIVLASRPFLRCILDSTNPEQKYVPIISSVDHGKSDDEEEDNKCRHIELYIQSLKR